MPQRTQFVKYPTGQDIDQLPLNTDPAFDISYEG